MSLGKFLYPWPKTQAIISGESFLLLKQLLEKNPLCLVSEKLDGCNFCVSSDGYTASRHNIVAHKPDDLSLQSFNKTSLENLKHVYAKGLNETIAAILRLPKENCETLIYGEFMLKGTAQTPYDIFNYREREIRTGEFYAFGIGFVYHQPIGPHQTASTTPTTTTITTTTTTPEGCEGKSHVEHKHHHWLANIEIEEKFRRMFERSHVTKCMSIRAGKNNKNIGTDVKRLGSCVDCITEIPYFVVPIDYMVQNLFYDHCILHVNLRREKIRFFDILSNNHSYINSLEKRTVEGWILNVEGDDQGMRQLLKLKYRQSKDERRDIMFEELRAEFPTNEAVVGLERIYNSCDEYCPILTATNNEFGKWYSNVLNFFGLQNLEQIMLENIPVSGSDEFSDDTQAIFRIFYKRIVGEIIQEVAEKNPESKWHRIDPFLKADIKQKLVNKFMRVLGQQDWNLKMKKMKLAEEKEKKHNLMAVV